ncbi:MAG: FkbM family methyltransferase [Pseudomonadota bacterium]
MTDDERARLQRRRKRRREMRIRAQGIMQGVVSMLGPRDVVFDCGANVGVITADLAATGAQVHAFEPDPVAFDGLLQRCGSMPNVTLHPVAVGAVPGTAILSRAADFDADPVDRTTRSTVLPGGHAMQTTGHQVEIIDLLDRIRTVIDTHGELAFLKLDIEGAELDLLEALDRAGLFAHIRLTVAETHPGKFPDLRPRFRALRQHFAATYPQTRVFLDWI